MRKKVFNVNGKNNNWRLRVFFCIFLLLATGAINAQVTVEPGDEDSTVMEDSTVIEESPQQNTTSLFDPVYDDSLRNTSISLRVIPDSSLSSIRKDPDFWYADSVFRGKKQRQLVRGSTGSGDPGTTSQPSEQHRTATTSFSSGTVGLLWVLIIAGFIAIVLLFLFNKNVNPFGKRNRKIDKEGDVEDTEDIFSINYQRDIDKAAAAGNYRLAIRLMFLRTLTNLANQQLIQYKAGRTNMDYLGQMSGLPHYADFFRLVRSYEYAWYGQFEVSPEAYAIIRRDFEQFKPGLHG